MQIINQPRHAGQVLSIQETANLMEKAVVWDVRVETQDFEIIDGEDSEGRFSLVKGSAHGDSYLITA